MNLDKSKNLLVSGSRQKAVVKILNNMHLSSRGRKIAILEIENLKLDGESWGIENQKKRILTSLEISDILELSAISKEMVYQKLFGVPSDGWPKLILPDYKERIKSGK